MACDIQQVRLNDLMVCSECMNCWAVCQKPDRLLVFPLYSSIPALLNSAVKLPFASFRAGY